MRQSGSQAEPGGDSAALGGGYPDEASPDQPRRKWWHVPDERIDRLIQSLATDLDGSEVTQLRVPERGGGEGDGKRGTVRGTRSRVTFQGPEGDALDGLLQEETRGEDTRGRRGSVGTADMSGAGLDKWWQVPDERIEDLVAELSRGKPDAEPAGRAGSVLGMSGGASLAISSSCGQPRLAAPRRKGEEKITVNILILSTAGTVRNGDTLSLRVSPDLRTGPSQPPPLNAFTDMFGQGASTSGFSTVSRTFDHRHRKFTDIERPGWTPRWNASLKGLIAQLTGIEESRQSLILRNVVLAMNDTTLRYYGVVDGETLRLKIAKLMPTPGPQRDVALATTSRRLELEESQREQESRTQLEESSLQNLRHLRRLGANKDVLAMPRWVSQARPQYFAPVGVAVDGRGSHKVMRRFGEMPIYVCDASDASLSRVREAVSGNLA